MNPNDADPPPAELLTKLRVMRQLLSFLAAFFVLAVPTIIFLHFFYDPPGRVLGFLWGALIPAGLSLLGLVALNRHIARLEKNS